MSKSLHEAIQEVASKVQTHRGTDIPVKYDPKRGGTKADRERLKKKVRQGAEIARLTKDILKEPPPGRVVDSVEHDEEVINEEDPHVAADPRHPANRGGGGGSRRPATYHVDVDGVKHHSQLPYLSMGGKMHGPGEKAGRLPKGAKYRTPVQPKPEKPEKTEEAYSPVKRASRLGDVIAGRAMQTAKTKIGTPEGDKARARLSKAQVKLIGMGARAGADKAMGDITRDRLGLKK